MTSRPDEAWHIDTTVIRLIDGTKAYVHAAIDNFSRRILAFRVGASFDIGNAVGLLLEAASQAVAPRRDGEPPMLVVDGGSENFNGRVDELVTSGILRRVLAQTDITFSNSMIEAFWRTLKHRWLFLDTLDTVEAVRRHVTFYVNAHNTEIPHSAFAGQTPDEVYFGRGDHVPAQLAAKRLEAQEAHREANHRQVCSACTGHRARSSPEVAEAA